MIPWIDRHDYPLGRNSCEALRTEILCCRHVIYLITEEYLSQGRGWTPIERSYSNLVQENLLFSGFGELLHVELPLIFLPPDHDIFLRSAWHEIKNKGVFCPPHILQNKSVTPWAADQIEKFILKEQQWGADLAEEIDYSSDLKQFVEKEPHLKNRLIASEPPPIIIH